MSGQITKHPYAAATAAAFAKDLLAVIQKLDVNKLDFACNACKSDTPNSILHPIH